MSQAAGSVAIRRARGCKITEAVFTFVALGPDRRPRTID